jgi:hypothetical protein
MDTYRILALPERERGSPKGFGPDAAMIRGVEAEQSYQLAAERPQPATVPPTLATEQACAALASDPSLEFFSAPNPSVASTAGLFLTWLQDHPAEFARARCGPQGCPAPNLAASLFRRAAILSIHDREGCNRARWTCYSLLLRRDDDVWLVDFSANLEGGRFSFKDLRFRRQPSGLID